jgi:hypothetical protein
VGYTNYLPGGDMSLVFPGVFLDIFPYLEHLSQKMIDRELK